MRVVLPYEDTIVYPEGLDGFLSCIVHLSKYVSPAKIDLDVLNLYPDKSKIEKIKRKIQQLIKTYRTYVHRLEAMGVITPIVVPPYASYLRISSFIIDERNLPIYGKDDVQE